MSKEELIDIDSPKSMCQRTTAILNRSLVKTRSYGPFTSEIMS